MFPLVFPILRSERLILRQLSTEDLSALVRHADNPSISKYILNMPSPYTELDASLRLGYVQRGFDQKVRCVFAIILKATQELIGEIGLHHHNRDTKQWQLAYWIGEDEWNQGYTTEAVACILNFAWTRIDCDLVYADTHLLNLGSARVLCKNGFTVHSQSKNLRLYKHHRP